MLQDLRFAVRTLRKNPGFTTVAVITLALGIGATSAIFSVVSAVLLRPLPYPAPDRLVMVWGAKPGQPEQLISEPDFQDWRADNHSFEDMGIERIQSVNLTGIDKPDRLIGDFVDAHTLRILGARAAQGRLFTDAETTVGSGADVAVLSYAAWKTRFGADPAIVGKSLILNGRPFVVIGVLSAAYHDPYPDLDVYLPITSPPTPAWLTRGDRNVWAVGRLKPGVTPAAAQRDLASVAAQVAATYPRDHAGLTASVQSLRDSLVGDVRPLILIVFAAVGFVLLIVCANVANLMLARAVTRQRELSLRAALGADRARLGRQLLTESLVLAVVGGGAGVALAYWGIGALPALVPAGALPVYGPIRMDRWVLLFLGAVVVAAWLLFGLAPAAFAMRRAPGEALRTRSGDAAGRRGSNLRNAFVGVQLALCIVLLVGVGLLARSLENLATARAGYDPHDVLTAEFRLPANKYRTADAITQFHRKALAELRAVPGIRSAALVLAVPLSGNWEGTSFIPDNHLGVARDKAPSAQLNTVTDGFFRTMKIPMIAGRDFDDGDRAATMHVAVVNEQLAYIVWPGESAVGRRLQLLVSPARWVTVVGVVADIKHLSMGEPPTPQIYVPMAQDASIFSSVVARTDGAPEAFAKSLRTAIWRVDPDQPVWKVRSLESLVTVDLAPRRFTMLVAAAFTVLALLLAVVGVYGVMSYVVTRRSREMGLRMALGARSWHVVALILGGGLKVVLVAGVVGLTAAFGTAHLLSHQLFGVTSTDPLTFVASGVVLTAVAMAACFVPARRAARIDPMAALRQE